MNFRLPADLIPTSYDLKIKPYIGEESVYGDKAFTFEGEIKMHFKCESPTRKVVFHSVNLTIDSQSVLFESEDGRDEIKADKNLKYDQLREYYVVDLNKECSNGSNYVLSLKFKGGIAKILLGFYRSSYKNTKGETK